MTAILKGFGLLLLLIVAVIFLAVLTRHAQGNHQEMQYSSERIYRLIEESFNQGGKGPCARLLVASCPLAKVEDRFNPNYGKPSPHVKAVCQLNEGNPNTALYATGIFGLKHGEKDPVYVTGYIMNWQDTQYKIKRDRCLMGDVTLLQNFFLPVPPAKK